jgi:hypothetical protein
MTNTVTATSNIADTAAAFFEACESGQGWAECARYCTPTLPSPPSPKHSPR